MQELYVNMKWILFQFDSKRSWRWREMERRERERDEREQLRDEQVNDIRR